MGLFVSIRVIRVRLDMEGEGCKKVLKNINGNVLANEDFSRFDGEN